MTLSHEDLARARDMGAAARRSGDVCELCHAQRETLAACLGFGSWGLVSVMERFALEDAFVAGWRSERMNAVPPAGLKAVPPPRLEGQA